MLFSFRVNWGAKPLGQPWHSILLLLVGLGLWSGSYYFFQKTWNKLSYYEKTIGIEIDQLANKKLVIDFPDQNGELHRLYYYKTENTTLEKGREYNILYNPDNPSEAIVNTVWGKWAMAMILFLGGSIFNFLSGLFWIWRDRLF